MAAEVRTFCDKRKHGSRLEKSVAVRFKNQDSWFKKNGRIINLDSWILYLESYGCEHVVNDRSRRDRLCGLQARRQGGINSHLMGRRGKDTRAKEKDKSGLKAIEGFVAGSIEAGNQIPKSFEFWVWCFGFIWDLEIGIWSLNEA